MYRCQFLNLIYFVFKLSKLFSILSFNKIVVCIAQATFFLTQRVATLVFSTFTARLFSLSVYSCTSLINSHQVILAFLQILQSSNFLQLLGDTFQFNSNSVVIGVNNLYFVPKSCIVQTTLTDTATLLPTYDFGNPLKSYSKFSLSRL